MKFYEVKEETLNWIIRRFTFVPYKRRPQTTSSLLSAESNLKLLFLVMDLSSFHYVELWTIVTHF